MKSVQAVPAVVLSTCNETALDLTETEMSLIQLTSLYYSR